MIKTRNCSNATRKFLTDLYKVHPADDIIKIIDDCYSKGYPNTKIKEALETQLKITIRPVFLRLIIETWYPDTYDLSIGSRKSWVYDTWVIDKLKVKQWGSLYDHYSDHPVYRHFTRANIINFYAQRAQAKKRGIEFKLDFMSWIVWWLSTGHFHERGVFNDSYQMCRKGDTGAYEWDNIYCDTGENNKNDYWNINRDTKINP